MAIKGEERGCKEEEGREEGRKSIRERETKSFFWCVPVSVCGVCLSVCVCWSVGLTLSHIETHIHPHAHCASHGHTHGMTAAIVGHTHARPYTHLPV